eukprot:3687949-Rhodomonas_salina.1
MLRDIHPDDPELADLMCVYGCMVRLYCILAPNWEWYDWFRLSLRDPNVSTRGYCLHWNS